MYVQFAVDAAVITITRLHARSSSVKLSHSSEMTVGAISRTLAFVVLFCSTCSAQPAANAGGAELSVAGLYQTIRKVAFPASPDLRAGSTRADGRFILLMPGKILNFNDYYPGLKYQKDTLVW